MSGHVDGFVIPVPKKHVAAYTRIADQVQPGAIPFDGERMFWGGFKVAVRL